MIIDKFQFENYEINQQFFHQTEPIYKGYNKWRAILDSRYAYEYLFIVIPRQLADGLRILLLPQLNGRDCTEQREFIFYNKIFPSECMKSYDDETNALLEGMVRNNMINILFFPFRFSKNEMPLIINDNDYLYITGNFGTTLPEMDLYFKAIPRCEKIQSIQTDFNAMTIYNFTNMCKKELIDQVMGGNSGYNKKMNISIAHNGPIFSNLYLNIIKDRDTKFVRNYYKVIKELIIEIGGHIISKIPIDYIYLYWKIIKGIQLNNFSHNNTWIIPINIKELINLPFVSLGNLSHHEVRVYIDSRAHIENFNYNIQKHAPTNNNYPEYISLINYLPPELWILIINYLDKDSFVNCIQSCRYFYSIIPIKNIENKYEKYKITEKDLKINDITINVVYNNIINGYDTSGMKNIINELRSIHHYKEIIINNNMHQFIIPFNDVPLEWIIIELDPYQNKNILENITFNQLGIYNFDEILKIELADCDLTNFYKIMNGPEFSKMHNPDENRYLFFFEPNLTYKSIDIKFKEEISCDINWYLATNNWFCYGFQKDEHPDKYTKHSYLIY